ncbi:MAG: restriction endonuclease subunit S [Actinomycetota bacterium]
MQLRHICRLKYGDSLPDEARQPGTVNVYGSNGPVGTHNVANTHGPVIVIGRKGSHGKLQFSDHPVFTIDTTYYIDSSATDVCLRWLYYALSVLQLEQMTFDVGVPGLSRERAYQERLSLPPLRAQRAIADFLDAETARIDALVERKATLVRLAFERFRSQLETYLASQRGHEVTLGRFVRSIIQGDSPQAEDRPAAPEEWGVLKLSAVKAGVFVPTENKALPTTYVEPRRVS